MAPRVHQEAEFVYALNRASGDPEDIEFREVVKSAFGSTLNEVHLECIALVLCQLGSHRWATLMLAAVVDMEWIDAHGWIDRAIDCFESRRDCACSEAISRLRAAGLERWIERWVPGGSLRP
jgi:hypothetical protein